MGKTVGNLDKHIQIDLSNFSVNGHTHDYTTWVGDHAEAATGSTANSPYTGMAKSTTKGLYLTGSYNDANTPVLYGNILNLAGRGTGQLLCEWKSGTTSATGDLYYRSHRDNAEAPWGPWKKIAYTDSNITGNAATATKLTNARTLTIGNTGKTFDGSANVSWSLSEIGAFPAAGGNLSGNLHLSTNNSTISGVCGGGTDRWAILGGGEDDNGYLEINTRDNGNEPIYVRQYNASGLVRTATLLDGSGNTAFPGTISEGGTALSNKYAAKSHGTHVDYATATPKAHGTAAVGTSAKVAREDHVHPLQTSVSGNAGTATKLATARNITIGNKTNSFDGSANIAFTLADIGAVPCTSVTSGDLNNFKTTGYYSLRNTLTNSPTSGHAMLFVDFTVGTPFQLFMHDGTFKFYKRTWNSSSSTWSAWTETLANSISGNAGTATKLATARTLTIGSKGKAFDGSGNVSWSLSEIGAAAAADATQSWDCVITCATWSRLFQFTGGGVVGGSFIVNIRGTRGNVVFNVTLLVNYSHSGQCNIVQLNNTSYSNLQVRGVVDTNGTGYFEVYDNANSATSSTTQTLNVAVTRVSGSTTFTKYTAFTTGATIPSGYTAKGTLTTVSGCHYSGNAATASSAAKLTTARTLTVGNTGKSFDGSGNASWTLAEIGAVPAAGGAMTGALTFPSTATSTNTSHPTQLAHGLLGCYSTLKVLANTDNSAGADNEYVHIAAGWGVTPAVDKGIAVYGTYANCFGKKISTEGHTHTLFTRSSIGDIGWETSSNRNLPVAVSAIAYWSGAYQGTASNLAYCNKGAFGTIVTKNTGDYATASHTHNAIVSRGSVTCETGANVRPAVAGLSMSQAYNNGYPTTYGNVISLRGLGDGQLLIGWSGTSGAHAPVYVRSRRDTTDADWSGWAQVYTTAHKPTPADIGLQREYKSAVADIYSSGITTGGSTLAADTYASHGKSYSFASTTTATIIYKAAFPELKYGKYAICVRMMSSNNTNTSNIAKIEILQGTTVKKTVNLTGKSFTSTSNYSHIYTDFEYTGNASAKQALTIQVSSLTVSGITLKFDYASIEMINPAVFL